MLRYILLTILLILLSLNSMQAQLSRGELVVDGTLRTYFVHIPENAETTEGLPLVINLHGFGSNATEQAVYSRFNGLADINNFIVVYPEGLPAEVPSLGNGQHWNAYFQTGIDDVEFVDELIDILWNYYTIDLSRVYVTGMSNGGFMAYVLACELSDRIAAVSSVTGSMIDEAFSLCTPGRPVPILQFHGTEDPIVPYDGSDLIAPIEDVIDYWTELNGCTGDPEITNIDNANTSDNSTVVRIFYGDCEEESQVDFYRIDNGGHTWPGALIEQPELGETNRDISASTLSWEFFRQFTHPDPRDPRLITNTSAVFDEGISIFPSLFKEQLNLKSQEPVEIMIWSVAGKTYLNNRYSAGHHRLQVDHWPAGVYIINGLTESGHSFYKRLIKY